MANGDATMRQVTSTTQTRTKPNLLLVKMKEKKLLKMQSLPKVLRSQAKKIQP
jgi:hypothetical protein